MEISQVWNCEHYRKLLENDKIRPGCEPKIMIYNKITNHSIVLLHGLTDSPFFMEAVGMKFYKMGFNVFIPLLPGHGLKEPGIMNDITFKDWQKEVDFAVKFAQSKGQEVSIGGLSTGGALSVWKAMTAPDKINGGVFLFSAALDLAGLAGNFLERLLRTRFIRPIVSRCQERCGKPLVGEHPYRYSRMNIDGAAQLSKLIQEIEILIRKEYKLNQPHKLTQPLFVAHSEYDNTADIDEIEKFINNHAFRNQGTELFRIGKHFHVPHASIVLAEDIKSRNQSPLEPKNPFFDEMMQRVSEFSRQHLILPTGSLSGNKSS